MPLVVDPAPWSAVSAATAPAPDNVFQVEVLGPLRSAGWGSEPDGELLREIAVFLAFRDDPVTLDEIALALWPVGGARDEPSRASLHTYMSRLRKHLGKDRLSDASGGRGYLLSGYETDWGRFQDLVARADASEGAEARALRREALALVRGVPFAPVPRGQYNWALESGLVEQMTVAITRCAHHLAEECRRVHDTDGARWAIERGLLASPPDEQLLGDLWGIAAATGDLAEQRRVKARITAVLGSEAAGRICGP